MEYLPQLDPDNATGLARLARGIGHERPNLINNLSAWLWCQVRTLERDTADDCTRDRFVKPRDSVSEDAEESSWTRK